MHTFHLRKRSALACVDKVARFHTCVRLLHCPISSWARGAFIIIIIIMHQITNENNDDDDDTNNHHNNEVQRVGGWG
jgi:hypothetical protein